MSLSSVNWRSEFRCFRFLLFRCFMFFRSRLKLILLWIWSSLCNSWSKLKYRWKLVHFCLHGTYWTLMELQLWAGPGVASLWACALDQMSTLRSTVSSVSVRKVISVVFCIHDCLPTIAMWRKLFTSVPAFRALKAPCRTLKSSSRGAERDFFKGKTIQLIYIKLCLRTFMLIWESITIQCMYTVSRDKVMRVFPKFSHFESYYDRKVNSLLIWSCWLWFVNFLGASRHVI